MNPVRIKWLIAVVTAAVTALVLVQTYWAYEAYRLGEEQFNRKVVTALQKTASDVNDRNECFELFSKVYIKPNEGFYMIKQAVKDNAFVNANVVSPDTVKMFFPVADAGVPYSFGDVKFSKYPASADVLLKFHYQMDDTASMGEDDRNTFAQMTSANFLDKISGDKPVDQRYDMAFLDSTLKKYLKDEGLGGEYHYGILLSKNDSVLYKSSDANERELKEGLTASLNRDKYFSKPYLLSLYFDHKQRVVLATFVGIMLTSVLVIALFVWSFWFFVKTIMRQKKLADVKNDFINNMTHEFNTPITNIALAVETMRTNGCNPDKRERLMEIVDAENNRMRRNIEKVLQIALVEKEGIRLNTQPIHVRELIADAVEQFRVKAERQSVDVEYRCESNGAMVNGDETHLINVLHNLLDNALKYSKEEGFIFVSSAVKDNCVSVSVIDNGIGMNKETLKNIFEKFYRAHTSDVHNVKGFGLGLNYVKSIVEAHRGTITANSKLGEGSEFEIWLPLHVETIPA